ncbi:tyrosine-protein phosphatase [Ureibacillus sinduriensis]|uniref:Tyrosine-protein phosphatase n=1 Tax=Ureibacillus sinduriensis BLB-1 = JCM 15800 TaxID=1384057 RepID=A0A0A3HUK4_9BACL|nr:CpsB/CapC family capsule biosynthesis tyrosine phosphatase [Ureibacillus sinduriensis]KGR73983.1 capsular biosynthesis protein [Ureibacillus sinduriensis BLB-1 = JCM 15800]
MIDIHSHILFNVDDGPKSLHDSLEMLKSASKEGITEIISTSHIRHPQFDVQAITVLEQVTLLQSELNKQEIPLTIHLGHEIRLCDDIVALISERQILTLSQSNFLLLELPSSHIPNYTKGIIRELLNISITPIIAHPERNLAICEKPERLEWLIREGAAAQLTAGSIAGHFGRAIQKTALELIKRNLVHTYGSDAHNLSTRPFLFEKGLSYLKKQKEIEVVDLFLENNSRIVENRPLLIYEPGLATKRKWWWFI